MEVKKVAWAITFLLSLVAFVSADTPANCTYEDIRGTWIFDIGPGDQDNTVNCTESFSSENTAVIKLSFPDIATDDFNNVGFWTLIYNQGFEVVVAGRKYFGFSYYDDTQSYCSEVIGGWSHDLAGHDWACFDGKKTESVIKPHQQPDLKVTSEDVLLRPLINSEEKVAAINKAQASWTAKRYPQFNNFITEDFIRISGGRKSQMLSRPKPAPITEEQKNFAVSLPKSLDWRDVDGMGYVSPIRDQGLCGSCYAYASMAMAEARVRIQTNNTQQPVYSTQDIVECSPYSQGCEGGFPYLVGGKYAEDFGLVLEECNPYVGVDRACETKATCTRHYFTDYSYIGGFYGGCNDILMQQAIYERGPIAVSFMVYDDFVNYEGGIYVHDGVGLDVGVDQFNPFEITNHVVLIVGWGELSAEDGGTKYWIVKNSWGTGWGLDGYFLILRGADECGIESIAVESTPVFRFTQ